MSLLPLAALHSGVQHQWVGGVGLGRVEGECWNRSHVLQILADFCCRVAAPLDSLLIQGSVLLPGRLSCSASPATLTPSSLPVSPHLWPEGSPSLCNGLTLPFTTSDPQLSHLPRHMGTSECSPCHMETEWGCRGVQLQPFPA